MDPKVKLMKSDEWLLGLPVLGKTLNQYYIVSSGRLWEVLKTMFWLAIAITISPLVGQLQEYIDCH